jgi:hypothetical protein
MLLLLLEGVGADTSWNQACFDFAHDTFFSRKKTELLFTPWTMHMTRNQRGVFCEKVQV